MGLRAKTKQRAQRLKEKRARKAAQKSLYEGFRDRGVNQKSKRFRLKSKLESWEKMRAHSHPFGACGNIGCRRCSEVAREAWTATHFLKAA